MEDNAITYDDNINIVNIELYQRNNFNNDLEKRYRCVCCKKPVSIRDSISSRGHRLVCNSCFIKYFDGDVLKAHEWMRKDEV